MNFDELNEIVAKEAGVNICPICGIPYEKYHSRQKTCGTDECKRLWHNKCLREHRKRKYEEDADAFRAYRREAQRKSRRKKRKTEVANENYQKLESYWIDKANRRIETDGLEYGKKQMERTLAQVPKIDTRIGDKK